MIFGHDAAERLTSKAASGLPTVSYGYNLLNEPTSLTSSVGTVGGMSVPAHGTSYAYDAAGRKLSETNDTRPVSYLWDGAGNRTRLTWPDGYYVAYEYDALNRLKYARENGTVELAYYDYDALSQRTLQCLGGQSAACSGGAGTNKVAYGYEPTGRLDALTHTMNGASAALGYDYNAAGQITGIMANEAFYLARPAGTGSSAYVADKLNRYGSVGGQAATYDGNGDLLTWYPPGGQHTYTFDVEGKLRSAAVGGSSTASIFYDYDPQGRRVTKAVGGTRTGYLLDGNEEIAEYAIDASGVWASSPLRRYIPGPGIDERIAQANNGQTSNPPKSYYHTNHQGAVMAMTNAAGTVSEKLAYDAYGNLTAEPPAAPTGQVYRYTGRRFDEETGLYYYRARYYSPLWGRFLQVDPIGYGDDFNLYAYVGNDPLNVFDPFGLCGATATEVTVCAPRYSPGWLITLVQELMSFWDVPVPKDDSQTQGLQPQETKPANRCEGQIVSSKSERLKHGADFYTVSISTPIPFLGISFTIDRYWQTYVGPAAGAGYPAFGAGAGLVSDSPRLLTKDGYAGGDVWSSVPSAGELRDFLSGFGASIGAGIGVGANLPSDSSRNRNSALSMTPGVGVSYNIDLGTGPCSP